MLILPARTREDKVSRYRLGSQCKHYFLGVFFFFDRDTLGVSLLLVKPIYSVLPLSMRLSVILWRHAYGYFKLFAKQITFYRETFESSNCEKAQWESITRWFIYGVLGFWSLVKVVESIILRFRPNNCDIKLIFVYISLRALRYITVYSQPSISTDTSNHTLRFLLLL